MQNSSSSQIVLTPLMLPSDLTQGTSYVEYQQNQWQIILGNTNALIGKSVEAEDKFQQQVQLINNMNNQTLGSSSRTLRPFVFL